jgi:small-conductance mechanosensitive channel
MRETFKKTFLENSLDDYLIAFGIIFCGIIITQIFKKIILNRLIKFASRTDSSLDDFLIKGIDKFFVPVLYFTAIYCGINYLTLSKRIDEVVKIATTVVITYLILRLVSTTILMLLENRVKRSERGEEKVKQLGGLMLLINIVIWVLGLVFLFDNLGYNISAIITGLGIGGIAVALAAQNILGDLFNYFVIFFDRPFEIGDFIVIDDKMGSVDYIGIKTTRVKSLSGEQLIFSNSDLTNSRIHNFKRMERRRVVFKVKVVYNVELEILKTIPDLLKSLIFEHKDTQFDRAHFSSIGDSSLEFEVVYFVLSSDYNRFMDIQQQINLRILEEFNNLGVQLAYPTQSLFLLNRSSNQEKERISEVEDSFVKSK